jgi:hypothetical protein
MIPCQVEREERRKGNEKEEGEREEEEQGERIRTMK